MCAQSRKFWQDNTFFGIASLLAGVFNYLYHVVLARVLGPGDYGDLAALLNVTALMMLPGPVVTLLYTRLGRRRPSRAIQESWLLWFSGVGLWLLLALLSRPLARALYVSPLLLIIFTLEIVPALALSANLGILQRVRWYFWVGLLTVLITAFRIVAAALAAFLHVWPLTTVGFLEGLAAFVAFGFSRQWASRAPWVGEPPKAQVISGTAVVGVINVLLAIADGLLAKHFLAPIAAGRFNGLATIGHTVQFISTSFGTVMLTSIMQDSTKRLRFLSMTILLYAGLAGLAETLFMIRPTWVIMTVLGTGFRPAARWLPYYGWGMIALGFINIAMLYSVALKRWEAITTTGLGLIVWVIRLSHAHTIGEFVRSTTTTLVAALLATVVVMMAAKAYGRWRGPVARRIRV